MMNVRMPSDARWDEFLGSQFQDYFMLIKAKLRSVHLVITGRIIIIIFLIYLLKGFLSMTSLSFVSLF